MRSHLQAVLYAVVGVAVASAQPVQPQEETNRGVCGISAPVPIGTALPEGEAWPWVASIMYNRARVCAAALITSRHLLTAAHCLDALPSTDSQYSSKVWVRLGSANLTDGDKTCYDYTIEIETIHKGYNSCTLDNDIAIITLDRNANFSKTVRPVCLPESTQSYEGEMATILGSGEEAAAAAAVGKQPPPRRILEAARLIVWNNMDCQESHQHPIIDKHICAGLKTGEINVCKGDSGGPMVVNGTSGWSVIGLVSWASRGGICGQPGEPVVYTRVAEYQEWINEHILKLNSPSKDFLTQCPI